MLESGWKCPSVCNWNWTNHLFPIILNSTRWKKGCDWRISLSCCCCWPIRGDDTRRGWKWYQV